MIDPSGKLVDRVTLHIRPAARIDVTVTEGATSVGGVYEVKKGFKVKVRSRVYDASGDEAIFAKHGVSSEYGNKEILGPDRAVLIGSTDVEDMLALSAGETSVRVLAPGAATPVRFRVIP